MNDQIFSISDQISDVNVSMLASDGELKLPNDFGVLKFDAN